MMNLIAPVAVETADNQLFRLSVITFKFAFTTSND